MTEQDCQKTYQELVAMLQDLQLGWVIEQVELSVPNDLSSYFDYDQQQAETASTQAVLTKPVTKIAQAQLLQLIEATERIVVDTTDIEGELVNFLAAQGERLNSPISLGFVEDGDTVTVPVTIDISPDRHQAATELRQFLQELRQEVMAGVD
jgi:hypothetical protein